MTARYLDTLDSACAACGVTYVGTHDDCPGYDLWAQRDATAVGIGSEQFLGRIDRSGRFYAHSLELEVVQRPKYEPYEPDSWRMLGHMIGLILIVGGLCGGMLWGLYVKDFFILGAWVAVVGMLLVAISHQPDGAA